MNIEYLIKNYASIILKAYIRSIKINALDVEIIDKDGKLSRYTKQDLETILKGVQDEVS